MWWGGICHSALLSHDVRKWWWRGSMARRMGRCVLFGLWWAASLAFSFIYYFLSELEQYFEVWIDEEPLLALWQGSVSLTTQLHGSGSHSQQIRLLFYPIRSPHKMPSNCADGKKTYIFLHRQIFLRWILHIQFFFLEREHRQFPRATARNELERLRGVAAAWHVVQWWAGRLWIFYRILGCVLIL
jgi:hypothetical protein